MEQFFVFFSYISTYHILMISEILFLLVSRKRDLLFKITAIFFPAILSVYFLVAQETLLTYLSFSSIKTLSVHYKPILSVFCLVNLITNLYVLRQNHRSNTKSSIIEIIINSLYCNFSILYILSDNLIFMFIILEIMAVLASTLIFLGNSRNYKDINAILYIITHILSGSLILVGAIGMLNNGLSLQITSLHYIINQSSDSIVLYISYYLLLIGCLINVAVPPFYLWFVKCYSSITSASFLSLITFTTKASLVILIKLFPGLDFLKYFGICAIIYGFIYACIEQNLIRTLCYLGLGQIGIVIVIISKNALANANLYIWVHILYKTLLSLVFIEFYHLYGFVNKSDITRTNSLVLNFGFLVSFLMLISFPWTLTYIVKHRLLTEAPIYTFYLMLFMQISNFIALPIKNIFFSKEISLNRSPDVYCKAGILLLSSIIIILNVFLMYPDSDHLSVSINTFIILIAGFVLSMIINIKHKDMLNYDISTFIWNRICSKFVYLKCILGISKHLAKKTFFNQFNLITYFCISSIKYLRIIHTQQTSIFIVFMIFTIMFTILTL
ncbi:MAG: proton-conducting transporter membrane subunit [Rickettsiaceae bacterium]